MSFLTVQATLNGQPFQSLLPDIEKNLSITDSQLYQIAKVIKEGIDQNLSTGTDYKGNPVQPLAPSTIKRKGHSRPFFETGSLFNSILYQKVSNNYYEVYVANSRDLILSYLQQGNRANNLPKREAFGISKNADAQIDKILTQS